ncbi:MAG: response regulator [Planctomycetaceae bacterium]
MTVTPTVYIVEDDSDLRAIYNRALNNYGLLTKSFHSAEEFLRQINDLDQAPRCAVVDLRLPGMSGLGLHTTLIAAGIRLPVIVMSGYGDIALAVQAMKGGAIDYLQKPFHHQLLIERVQEALDRDARDCSFASRRREMSDRIKSLTKREQEVMSFLVDGRMLKEISNQLGISHQTVAKHRLSLFEKLGIDSLAELVRLQIENVDSSRRN